MFRLIYTSSQSSSFDRLGFEQLCDTASRNNHAVGVGGLLLCNDLEFMQCLEGPHNAVASIYKRITQDSRHTDIRLLMSEPASERLFNNWSMVGLAIKPRSVLSAEPIAYTLLDHRLYWPWKSLGTSAVDLMFEYAKVKSELEKAGDTGPLSKVFEVYQP
ncbi:BLUF domain-containing protein [Limnobacter parvus]|uniref:BLUF domain-containing protein n=1 Tax=Limnobacter parvus TaxID=2939690 RepID=A0ABT1XG18_9BURK|nr:BLUF domain-containing protein [Limnobacter parvus]MCR2746230.1 BLUF domain-containing protein [Limnobacter parvus]